MTEYYRNISAENTSPYQQVDVVYDYVENHPPLSTPDWLENLQIGDEFRSPEQINTAYRYIDYRLIANGVYNTNAPSRLILDHYETINKNGIYRVLARNIHPDFISFDHRRFMAPPEYDIIVLEEVELPKQIKIKKYLVALFNTI